MSSSWKSSTTKVLLQGFFFVDYDCEENTFYRENTFYTKHTLNTHSQAGQRIRLIKDLESAISEQGGGIKGEGRGKGPVWHKLRKYLLILERNIGWIFLFFFVCLGGGVFAHTRTHTHTHHKHTRTHKHTHTHTHTHTSNTHAHTHTCI